MMIDRIISLSHIKYKWYQLDQMVLEENGVSYLQDRNYY